METHICITELNYFECPNTKAITGGSVYVNGFTSAAYDSALAYAESYASGFETYTATHTFARINRFTTARSSYSRATSRAETDRESAYFRSTSKYFG